ncbi:sugar phosphate isomerase/epimerase family protein [Chengkuizengella axinellae]|uniref:Sugar phosphate isomerase/epimerase family protein n=1 Tax=Chengkuizengella axinellae TaxID=3064388 RepID=A0ABT9IZP7_9BACL|nr:sugar phosphate isomerase/epimerase family protein [Chengkuizengella sp. 2205SS18-9]MDP5274831.1 sugar phosphate isomerase/epimerase family protein [Chengkuizengella sp. 2205SS18-9]
MKKGINIWAFPEGMKISECMTIAKDAGFEGIELALNEIGELSLESNETEMFAIRKQAKDMQLEITSLATGLYWNYSLTSNQEHIRNKAKDIMKKQLQFASILGVDTILVVPGAVGVDFIPDSEVVPYDQAYDYALEALTECASEAEHLKVSIGIENVWNKFLLSPLEMKGFIDKINSDYVGAYFDVGNVLYSGYSEQWIHILNTRIKKVHFKDYRRDAGGLHGFVDLLAGDVDYPVVIAALQNIGYNGYVTAEMIPPYKHHSTQIIYNTSQSMSRILKDNI